MRMRYLIGEKGKDSELKEKESSLGINKIFYSRQGERDHVQDI